jgi:hypothetical protein
VELCVFDLTKDGVVELTSVGADDCPVIGELGRPVSLLVAIELFDRILGPGREFSQHWRDAVNLMLLPRQCCPTDHLQAAEVFSHIVHVRLDAFEMVRLELPTDLAEPAEGSQPFGVSLGRISLNMNLVQELGGFLGTGRSARKSGRAAEKPRARPAQSMPPSTGRIST